MNATVFGSVEDIRAAIGDMTAPDDASGEAARARNASLTKPPGALGRLEDLAIWYARWRGDARPRIERPQIAIFAGNHGVAARGVSAFPPEVTRQMVDNFAAGGAAINQIAGTVGARIAVRALSLDRPTEDFTRARAMDEAALCEAVSTGWETVDPDADLLVPGEMGIANTSSAAALAAALYGGGAAAWVGRGTGVEGRSLDTKTAIVAAGLERHAGDLDDPLAALACLGGREIAAMAGAIMRARQLRIPVILDGFVSTVAAAVLATARAGATDHCLAGHRSVESGHGRLLQRMGLVPILELDMRLGEGSGAAVAIGILKAALACHSGMATFGEAGVSDA